MKSEDCKGDTKNKKQSNCRILPQGFFSDGFEFQTPRLCIEYACVCVIGLCVLRGNPPDLILLGMVDKHNTQRRWCF